MSTTNFLTTACIYLKKCLYKGIPIVFLSLLFLKSYSQNVTNYVLLPGSSSMLPVGEQMKFAIQWYSDDGLPHEGVNAFTKKQVPQWTVNGQPYTNQNPANGQLSIDLNLERATYTAPSKIPSANPVVIAVKFPASDTSKEMVTLICQVKIVDSGNKWYVSFTYSGSSFKSEKSVSRERTNSYQITGFGSMLVKAAPPETNGYVLINTSEGDSVISYTSSGQWSEKSLEITRGIVGNIENKTIRNHQGTPTKDQLGIEFEYDPVPNGNKGLGGIGLDYTGGGKEVFYSLDNNNHLVKKGENNGPFTTSILMGHSKDILKKTANGFSIDYVEKKDTSYTNVLGAVYKETSNIEYHVIIIRKGGQRKSVSNIKPNKYYNKNLPPFISNIESLSLVRSLLRVKKTLTD